MFGMFGPALLFAFSGLPGGDSGVEIDMPPPPRPPGEIGAASAPPEAVDDLGRIALARYAHRRSGPRNVHMPSFRTGSFLGSWTSWSSWGPTSIGPVWWAPYGWWSGGWGWTPGPCPRAID